MSQLNRESLLDKWVEVSMDSDHSTTVFSRRGKVVHIYASPPAKEAVVVVLEPLRKRKLFGDNNRYLILEYEYQNKDSILDTFGRGYSFARVLRIKRPEVFEKDSYSRRDSKCMGFADVTPSHPEG